MTTTRPVLTEQTALVSDLLMDAMTLKLESGGVPGDEDRLAFALELEKVCVEFLEAAGILSKPAPRRVS